MYIEKISTNNTDPNHYDNLWDWWFVNDKEDTNPNLIFELTSEKDENGKYTTNNMYINVYTDEDSSEPIDTIHDTFYRISWVNRKAFTLCKTE